MKNKLIAMMAILGVGVISAQASIEFSTSSGDHANSSVFKTWTITNLLSNPQSIIGVNVDSTQDIDPLQTNSTAYSVGTVTGAQATDSFSFTATAATNWTTAGAQSAVGGSAFAFGTYLSTTLDSTGVEVGSVSSSRLGVDSGALDAENNRFNPGEALMLTFDTTGLDAGSSLSLLAFTTAQAAAAEFSDVVFYDASSGLATAFAWDEANMDDNTDAPSFGTTVIDDGDILVFATGASQLGDTITDGWRVETLTFDVIPEPATLGMVAVFGGAILFIRRRFMI